MFDLFTLLLSDPVDFYSICNAIEVWMAGSEKLTCYWLLTDLDHVFTCILLWKSTMLNLILPYNLDPNHIMPKLDYLGGSGIQLLAINDTTKLSDPVWNGLDSNLPNKKKVFGSWKIINMVILVFRNLVMNSSYTSSKWPWSLGTFEHSTRGR